MKADSMPPSDLAGTGSLVTVASGGLGAELASRLAARGSDLVLVARSAGRLAALAEELQARRRVTVTTWPADLSLADEVSRAAAVTATTGSRGLVNNAGFGTHGALAGLNAGREHSEMMVTAVAAVDLAHAAPPGMPARRSGGIITIAPAIAFQPQPAANRLRREQSLRPGVQLRQAGRRGHRARRRADRSLSNSHRPT
jgi:short-subunit dehydrogenase